MKKIQRVMFSSTAGRLLLASTIAVTMVVTSTKVLADFASDIETDPNNTYAQYDNESGDYPIITAIGEQPGLFGGKNFTGWTIFAQDSTGSLELFLSANAMTNLTGGSVNAGAAGTPYTSSSLPAVGDAINIAGQYQPFDGIPELDFITTVTSNNYVNKISSGNTVPTPPVFTIPQLQQGTGNGSGVLTNPAIAGMILTIQNVTISPGPSNTFATVFPLETQANTTNETYEITDGSNNKLELFDWTTSYSIDAAMGGSAVPTGPVNVTGFFDGFDEFVPVSIQAVPEPSSVALVGLGVAGLVAIRRRRSQK